MNRPKKNKIKNPTIPDDRQDLLDERNLIDLKDSKELSFEERIHMYWMENKTFISTCVSILILGILTFNITRIYRQYAEEKIQSYYVVAEAEGSLADFALEYPDETLGGLAALKTADAAYKAGEFERALKFYSVAVGALSESIPRGRALTGQAFARFYLGQEDEAREQLAGMAADQGLPDSTRAEAAYHLAIDANFSGNRELYQHYRDQLESLPNTDLWQQRIRAYGRTGR